MHIGNIPEQLRRSILEGNMLFWVHVFMWYFIKVYYELILKFEDVCYLSGMIIYLFEGCSSRHK
jgi:hypothetical protein